MHSQLQTILQELNDARNRLHTLAAGTPEESWKRRPDPARWSMSECVAHLNLTSAAYIPLLNEGISRARQLNGTAPKRYRNDLIGWLLLKTMGPPVRFRVKTSPPFVPEGTGARSELVALFDRLQEQQLECVRECDGLPVDRVKITSPFEARLKYNLYSSLAMLPPHQHRHLWQAERVWKEIEKETHNQV